jgi:hypothetical protein
VVPPGLDGSAGCCPPELAFVCSGMTVELPPDPPVVGVEVEDALPVDDAEVDAELPVLEVEPVPVAVPVAPAP